MKISLVMSFPVPELNPNHCCHWSKKARFKADARAEGIAVSKKHKGKFSKEDRLHLSIKFYPPRRRSLDLDNSLASCKSAIDGIADGIGINDRQIKRITVEQCHNDGKPRIEIIIDTID